MSHSLLDIERQIADKRARDAIDHADSNHRQYEVGAHIRTVVIRKVAPDRWERVFQSGMVKRINHGQSPRLYAITFDDGTQACRNAYQMEPLL